MKYSPTSLALSACMILSATAGSLTTNGASAVHTNSVSTETNGKNLIWIITDEHNLRTIGVYRDLLDAKYPNDPKQAEIWGAGNVVETPNLDHIARKGAIFTNMHAATPVCTPSRASMFTGIYGSQLGLKNNSTTVSDGKFLDDSSVTTIAEVLKDAGYWTTYIGKWHLSGTAAEDNDWWSPGYPAPYDEQTNPEGSFLHPSYVEISDYGWQDRRWMFNNGHGKYKGIDAEGNPYNASNRPKIQDLDGDGQFFPQDLDDVDALGHPIYADDKSKSVKFTTDWLFDRAVDVIKNPTDTHAPRGNDPFFMVISIPDPHTPDSAREPYASNYNDMDIQMPHTFQDPNFPGGASHLDTNPSWMKPDAKANKSKGAYKNHASAVDALSNGQTPYKFQLFDDLKQYFGMVEAIDYNIGLLVDQLEAQGVLENTLIMFSADHGDLLGEHGRLNKSSPYDMSVAIPFIVVDGSQLTATKSDSAPMIPSGLVVEAAATNADWLETFLRLLDVTDIPKNQGRDLTPLLSATPPQVWDDIAVVEQGYWIAAISSRYKLVIDNSAKGDVWLFDLDLDPDEFINRLNDPAYHEIVKKLAQGIKDGMQAHGIGASKIKLKVNALLAK
ncbi:MULTISPECIES: sulfatase-like hydrolase/transferase [unclassified Lentimonas]|uniref:sulfatase-like hydrolase/transferase n=1 Tax=unclassified Lentimonas TaxID=2630993 RepID=UPI00132AB83B|nr:MULTISPECIES: sulfatase-like hydrolase/transferase [unclassified Lentimonas]CAA6696525.1 Choline-sulfatase (EC [Lentimonas sp. CC19]CAA6696667.1 Choline-sulfatase (EC [Lentimonas sp. CC10]CAA7072451.1 Choline-sulfatase (EC [Lentimonas sp. CC11]